MVLKWMALNHDTSGSHGSEAASGTLALAARGGRNCERHEALGAVLFGWHSGTSLTIPSGFVFRFSPAWISAAAAALAASVAIAPAQAQAPAAAAKPAAMELMNDLALTSAVNACELAVAEKVPLEKSVIASAKAITFLVTNRYGSQVAGAGKLSTEQIANGSIIQIVARVKQGCYDRITAADKKFVDGVLSEVEKAAKSQPQQQQQRR